MVPLCFQSLLYYISPVVMSMSNKLKIKCSSVMTDGKCSVIIIFFNIQSINETVGAHSCRMWKIRGAHRCFY